MSGLDRYFGLTGKVALVTGSTSGIGLAIAEAFVAAGAKTMICSNQPDAVADVTGRLTREGTNVAGHVVDVRDRAQLDALVTETEATLGPIDVLVCNAGVSGFHGSLSDVSEDAFDDTFCINLKHPLYLAGRIAPTMAARGGGSIILTASLGGLRGNKAIGLYSMTKAALIALARNLAVEWGPHGVRANAIAPGLTNTSWTSALLANSSAVERRLSLTPLRRAGEPWEIAAAALYLAGPGSAFTTGHTLVVDGGTLITDGN